MEKTSYERQASEIYALGFIMIEVLTKEPIDAVELEESVTRKMQGKESLLAMIRDEIKLSGCNYGRALELRICFFWLSAILGAKGKIGHGLMMLHTRSEKSETRWCRCLLSLKEMKNKTVAW